MLKGDSHNWSQFLGPNDIDVMIRNALKMCWMILPAERRSFAEVDRLFRQMVDRAIRDFGDDAKTFSQGK